MDPSSLVSSLVSTIVSQGLLGVLLVITGFLAWSKDRELKAERLARIEDAQKYSALSLKLQERVMESVSKVSSIMNEMKKLMGRPATFGAD